MQLDHLQNRLVAALRTLPGVTTLYLFGSRTSAASDQYADIDLQVMTADLPTARVAWPHFLEAVGPMELAWPITAAPQNTAFAILFQGESYYHKVDIGLSDVADTTPFASPSSYVPLWAKESTIFTPLPQHTNAYMPAYGTIGHLLFDELIGGVRYIKARKRGQHFTCWRFIRGKPERLLHLTYERLDRWKVREKPLSTWDYKELDALVEQPEREQLMKCLDWSEPRRMDENFCWFTHRIVQLLEQKAAIYGEAIPSTVVEQHLAFICNELQI